MEDLDSRRPVQVDDRGYLAPSFRANVISGEHQPAGRADWPPVLQPVLLVFGKNRRAVRPKLLPMLDLEVQNVPDGRQSRIREETAVAECPRTEFEGSLKPADDLSVRQALRRLLNRTGNPGIRKPVLPQRVLHLLLAV